MDKSIITLVLDLLKVDDFYYESESIDIAKGKYYLPDSFKSTINHTKRNRKKY